MTPETPKLIEIFPERIQRIIEHYCDIKGYPQEYFIVAFLAATSTSVGRSVVLNTGNFTAIALLWCIIVGKTGLTKSEAQIDAFKPIKDFQFEEIAAYQREIEMLSAKKDQESVPQPDRFFLNDITPEALAIVLAMNPKGCGMVYDELAGFIGRFNRYAAGGDEQMYLSLFNGDAILRTRVESKTNAASKNSFLTIIGTTQPAILAATFADKNDSGFFDRWLMCYPEDVVKPYPNESGLNPVVETAYKSYIANIMLIGFREFLNPHEMRYSPSSYKIINNYQRKLIDIENTTDNDKERSILAKMEIYLHRLALLLQVSLYALDRDPEMLKLVSDESATGATILCEYFLTQAIKIRVKSGADKLTGSWRLIYEGLPEPGIEFDRAYFINCCNAHKIKIRTADNFLKENSDKTTSKLFFKVNHGKFTKNLQ